MRIFVAGAMQGANTGYGIIDQGYRAEIQLVLSKSFPDCEITCPLTYMSGVFQEKMPELIEMHRSSSTEPFLSPDTVGPPLTEVMAAFRELVGIAGTSDLVIAYLPSQTPSMGTAMEMWAAFSNGVPVVTITDFTQNLAVLSASTFIVPSIEKLDELLQSGKLVNPLKSVNGCEQ